MKYNKYKISKRNNLLNSSSKKAVVLSIAITLFFAAGPSVANNTFTMAPNVQSKFKSVSTGHAIKDQYIVVFKSQYIDQQMSATFGQASINSVSAMDYRRFVVENISTEMAHTHDASVTRKYHAALAGFTARMTMHNMSALLADDRVAFIEQDQIMTTNIVQDNATWGLDRIDQENRPLNSQYNYNFDGSGVHAYVIDTGIFIAHDDFGGRVLNGRDFVNNDNIANDCDGHGTHVAGTIGSTTYGVAKNVTLVPVRVLGCNGSGSNSRVIAGVDWVAQNAIQPAVANMSLGGGSSTALDNAVQNAINSGVTFVVAAGNSNSNACVGSPNRVADALTVASSTSTDRRSGFSNWGSCVDLFAPGSSITSTWINGSTSTISGTSMASPHVAGVAALYLENNPAANPAAVHAAVVNNATGGKITNLRSSPNLLVQSIFDGSTPPPPIPPPSTNVLEKAVAITGLSGLTGSETHYTMVIPAGATNLSFNISNGAGDADLYVKFGSASTIRSYDCRPYRNGNSENCNFSNPSAGTYHIMLRSYDSYSGVSLIGNYTAVGSSGGGEASDSFFENTTDTVIPDNNFTGVTSSINVVREGSAGVIDVVINIKHTYIGNLIVEGFAPNGGSAILHNRSGSTTNDLIQTYTFNLDELPAAGVWQLKVRDLAGQDTGYIDSWSITFK